MAREALSRAPGATAAFLGAFEVTPDESQARPCIGPEVDPGSARPAARSWPGNHDQLSCCSRLTQLPTRDRHRRAC